MEENELFGSQHPTLVRKADEKEVTTFEAACQSATLKRLRKRQVIRANKGSTPHDGPLGSRDDSVITDPKTIPVDSEGKATTIRLLDFQSKQMRAFWISTISYFVASFVANSISTLSPYIQMDLKLTSEELRRASIAAMLGSVIGRLSAGILSGVVGPRLVISYVQAVTSIMVFCMAAIKDATGFVVLRFFCGFLQSIFVGNMVWITYSFSSNIVGTATALSAGLSHTGAALSPLVFGEIYAQLERTVGMASAWRRAIVIGGAVNLIAAFVVYKFTNDSDCRFPGGWRAVPRMMATGGLNYRTMVVTMAYTFSIGTQFAILDKLPGYLRAAFGLTRQGANSVVAMYQLTNLLRPLGGILSDRLGAKMGFGPKIWIPVIFQTAAGFFMILLGRNPISRGVTDGCLVLMLCCLTVSAGSTIALSSFLSARSTGPIIGIIAAGGSAGNTLNVVLFFSTHAKSLQLHTAIIGMGALTIVFALPLLAVFTPCWGGPVIKRVGTATEEEYFLSDYSIPEIRRGIAQKAGEFAAETRTLRGQHRSSLYEHILERIEAKAKQMAGSEASKSPSLSFEEESEASMSDGGAVPGGSMAGAGAAHNSMNPACDGGLAVVTGASSAVGCETVRALAKLGFMVVVACRKEEAGREVVDKVTADDPKGKAVFHKLDVMDSSTIDDLVQFVRKTSDGVDILVNNAGHAAEGAEVDSDAARMTLGINFWGVKNVTTAFLPILKPGCRIINVSSRLGMARIIPSDSLREAFTAATTVKALEGLANKYLDAVEQNSWDAEGFPGNMYGVSRLLENLYSKVLARQLEDDPRRILVVGACPGRGAESSFVSGKGPEEGADCQAWLAAAERRTLQSGAFYADRRILSLE